MNYPKERYTESVKHEVVRRWNAAKGRGSTVKRNDILREVGCTQSSVYRWRAEGYGQPPRVATPTASTSAAVVMPDESEDVLDWLIKAIDDLSLDEGTADRLLAHRARWERRK